MASSGRRKDTLVIKYIRNPMHTIPIYITNDGVVFSCVVSIVTSLVISKNITFCCLSNSFTRALSAILELFLRRLCKAISYGNKMQKQVIFFDITREAIVYVSYTIHNFVDNLAKTFKNDKV